MNNMKDIHEELADLSAEISLLDLRNMFASYLRTEDKEIIDSFINLVSAIPMVVILILFKATCILN